MAWATVLINTSLLAFEMCFFFHPITLLAIRSWISLKIPTLDFPPTIGSPKYFLQSFMTWAPNKDRISSFTSRLVFWLKNRAVFCQLIAWPEATSYGAKMDRRFWHSLVRASQSSKVSSANKRWDIQTPPWHDRRPCSCRVSVAYCSIDERQRYGEKGSPWRIPWDGVMKPLGSSLRGWSKRPCIRSPLPSWPISPISPI